MTPAAVSPPQLGSESPPPARPESESSRPATALSGDDSSNESSHGSPADTAAAGAPGGAVVKSEPDDDLEVKNLSNAPFVSKVWNMVNEPANHRYIRWMPGGKAIQIVDRDGFEKKLLPYYFKHKRFTSFVRQLNMYGWHKVQDLSAGTMQSSEEHWEFASPYFIEGHPELLKKIVRNRGHRTQPSGGGSGAVSSATGSAASGAAGIAGSDASANQRSLQAILKELEQIRAKQINIGEDLGRMRRDNELLWTEYYQTRERYDKHSQMLSRILRFLATVYGNQSKILDLTQAEGAGDDRFLHHRAAHMPQLLPAASSQPLGSPAGPPFNSGYHDLREIEELQNQIQEATTPSSSKSADSPASTTTTSAANTPGVPGRPPSSHAGATTPATQAAAPHNTSNPPAVSGALVPSRRVSQALIPAAPAPHLENYAGGPGVGHQAQQQASQSQNQSQNQSQSLVRSRTMTPQLDDDPAKLFPELGNLDAGPGVNIPPLTSQELEQISRDVAMNGISLQNIQDWLSKQSIDEPDLRLQPADSADAYGGVDGLGDDADFNVDDFLTPDESKHILDDNSGSGEPDRKRVRVL